MVTLIALWKTLITYYIRTWELVRADIRQYFLNRKVDVTFMKFIHFTMTLYHLAINYIAAAFSR